MPVSPEFFQESLSALARALPNRGALLALDLGAKTIGLALSDPAWTLATPLETITRSKSRTDLALLADRVRTWQVTGLVLGLPLGLDGSDIDRTQPTRSFAGLLRGALPTLPLAFWDERWTTSAMERHLIQDRDMSRARRGQVIDKLAALSILQAALEFLRHNPGPSPLPSEITSDS